MRESGECQPKTLDGAKSSSVPLHPEVALGLVLDVVEAGHPSALANDCGFDRFPGFKVCGRLDAVAHTLRRVEPELHCRLDA